MLSSNEYKLLKSVQQAGELTVENCAKLISIFHAGYLTHPTTERNGSIETIYGMYTLTPAGEAAIEEYERTQGNINRENKSLKVAHKANVISIVSLCVSSLLSIPALIVSIISLLQ